MKKQEKGEAKNGEKPKKNEEKRKDEEKPNDNESENDGDNENKNDEDKSDGENGIRIGGKHVVPPELANFVDLIISLIVFIGNRQFQFASLPTLLVSLVSLRNIWKLRLPPLGATIINVSYDLFLYSSIESYFCMKQSKWLQFDNYLYFHYICCAGGLVYVLFLAKRLQVIYSEEEEENEEKKTTAEKTKHLVNLISLLIKVIIAIILWVVIVRAISSNPQPLQQPHSIGFSLNDGWDIAAHRHYFEKLSCIKGCTNIHVNKSCIVNVKDDLLHQQTSRELMYYVAGPHLRGANGKVYNSSNVRSLLFDFSSLTSTYFQDTSLADWIEQTSHPLSKNGGVITKDDDQEEMNLFSYEWIADIYDDIDDIIPFANVLKDAFTSKGNRELCKQLNCLPPTVENIFEGTEHKGRKLIVVMYGMDLLVDDPKRVTEVRTLMELILDHYVRPLAPKQLLNFRIIGNVKKLKKILPEEFFAFLGKPQEFDSFEVMIPIMTEQLLKNAPVLTREEAAKIMNNLFHSKDLNFRTIKTIVSRSQKWANDRDQLFQFLNFSQNLMSS